MTCFSLQNIAVGVSILAVLHRSVVNNYVSVSCGTALIRGREAAPTGWRLATGMDGAQGARAAGNFTPEMQTECRSMLDALNDEINAALKAAEEGANRTPILNHIQHRFEEKIEFGVRSGRLSEGEASRLTRMVEKLKRLEERAKEGELSTRDREKLFAEAGEIARELEQALMK